jgi:hypothetical protein
MQMAYRQFGRAIRPLYYAKDNGRPAQLGSCVLVRFRKKSVLVTAAHVIDNNATTSLYIPIKGKLTRLEGSGVATTAPNGDRARDRLDFCIVELPSKLASDLHDATFIEEGDIASNLIDPHGRGFMALGYPNSRNKKIDHTSRHIRPRVHSYGATVVHDEKFLNKLGLSGEDHILIKYERQSRDPGGEIVNSIKPVGMSGGALLDLGNLATPRSIAGLAPLRFSLSGLLIEFHQPENRIVAVRSQTIFSVL